jgi:prolipoprotein diacylglyceryltransferase
MINALAYYLHDLSPYLIRFNESFALHWYGLAYVLGFYLTYRVMLFLAHRGLSEIKESQVADFITLVALFGVVLGGRIGYMLLYDWDQFVQTPWMIFMIHKGGMASQGGIAEWHCFASGMHANTRSHGRASVIRWSAGLRWASSADASPISSMASCLAA